MDSFKNYNIVEDGLPIIDLQEENCPQKIRYACENIGFFYIKNKQVDPQLIDDYFKISKVFFNQSEEFKNKFKATVENYYRGYTPIDTENTGQKKLPDTKEAFRMADHYDIGSFENLNYPFHGPNVFPSKEECQGELEQFQEIFEKYHSECIKLARIVQQKLALSMGLQQNYFDPFFTKAYAEFINEDKENYNIHLNIYYLLKISAYVNLRMIHYTPVKSVLSNDLLACGAHTDFGLFTLLKNDKEPGLQVLMDQKWINIPPREDCFILNIGDLITMLTNGVYKSPVHRVVNLTGNERFSSPLFYDPNWASKISPIEQFITEKNPKQYEDTTFGEHFMKRFDYHLQSALKGKE